MFLLILTDFNIFWHFEEKYLVIKMQYNLCYHPHVHTLILISRHLVHPVDGRGVHESLSEPRIDRPLADDVRASVHVHQRGQREADVQYRDETSL